MAAVTHGIQTASTLNVTSYAAGTFTPAASDLLVGMVAATDTVAAGTMTSTGNTAAWTKITTALFQSSAGTCYLFVQNALTTATATVVTFDCTGDAATGAIIAVARISGMTRTGASAVRQSAVLSNLAVALGNPISSPTLAAAALTGNPTIEFAGTLYGGGSPETFNPPTNWTEGVADGSYLTPNTAFEYHFRNSGFTGTNTGWADTTGGADNLGIILAEFDTSAAGVVLPPKPVIVSTAIQRAANW